MTPNPPLERLLWSWRKLVLGDLWVFTAWLLENAVVPMPLTPPNIYPRGQATPGKKQVNNWNLSGIAGLPADGKLDLTKLGLGQTSM